MIRKGMTLTEVLVAMALIGLCVGGIVALIVQSMGLGQSADYMFVATNLAKNRMEQIRDFARNMGYTALPEAAEDDVAIDRNGVPDLTGDYSRTTEINSAYATGITMVTVKVKYKIRGSFLSQYIKLVTLISSYS